jgi:hypothetical protein
MTRRKGTTAERWVADLCDPESRNAVNSSSKASCSSPRRRATAHARLSFGAYSALGRSGVESSRRADDLASPTGVGDGRRGREAIEVGESGLRESVRIRDAVNDEIADIGAFRVATDQPAKLTRFSHPAGGA